MRIFWLGRNKPRVVPPGLTHVEGNIYEAVDSHVAREVGGRDSARWSLSPDVVAADVPDEDEPPARPHDPGTGRFTKQPPPEPDGNGD